MTVTVDASPNGPTILITGATGMIGSLVVDALVSRSVPLRAMVRDIGKTSAIGDLPGVTVVKGDFDDPASMDRALVGIERAFLVTNSSERTEAQQKRFVEAAGRAGARIVKLSQLAADANSPVRFLRYHAAVEAAIRETNDDWTFIRPNLILQAYLAFAGMIATDGQLMAPISDALVSVVDARDIAAVAAEALTGYGHEGRVYTITGPAAVSHGGIAAAFGRAIGRDVTFAPVPPEAFGGALQGMGMPPWQADGLLEDYAHYERGEAAVVSPDVERVTGSVPRDIDTFAADYADQLSGA